MNCNCCCTKTLNYCNQNVCGEIDFDIKAQVDGVHRLQTEFLGKMIVIEKEFSIGDNLIFPLDTFNENFQYTVELYDPNDARILVRKDEIDYDCLKFRTMIMETVNLVVES